MELYIGGYAQGKFSLVADRYPDAAVFDEKNYDRLFDYLKEMDDTEKVIINHFHLLVKEGFDDIERLFFYKDNLIIISDEVGNGVVPIEEEERMYREKTGRFLTRIASESECVVRIICGLWQRIK